MHGEYMLLLKSVLIILCINILSLHGSQADEITVEDFCGGFEQIVHNKKNTKINLIQAFQILYLTRTLIEPVQIKYQEDVPAVTRDNGRKIIFIHLPDTTYDKAEMKKIKNRKKEIRGLKLFKLLRKVTTKNECVEAIQRNYQDYENILNYIEESKENSKTEELYKHYKIMSLTLHQLKPYQRKGWEIIKSKDLFEFYQIINSDSSISKIMLINHADELGRLYDAKNNIFPNGAFSNFPTNIQQLTVFSCHPLEVVKYYNINSPLHKYDYFYPQVKRDYAEFFGENIPVLAIRGMLKINKRQMTSTLPDQNKCQVRMEAQDRHEEIFIKLNDVLISAGNLNQEVIIPINCGLINNDKNIIKVYSLIKNHQKLINITKMEIIFSDNTSEQLTVKNFTNNNNSRHIVTIGTTGGHQ